jgi:hypothetical protein
MAATTSVVQVKEETTLVALGSLVMMGLMAETMLVEPAALEMAGTMQVVPGSRETVATSLVVWARPEMVEIVLVVPG